MNFVEMIDMTEDRASAVPAPGSRASTEPQGVSAVPASIPDAKRPSRYDPEIVKRAAQEIAAACAEWDQNNSDPAEWVDDLIKCRHDWDDGYRLTKALEDRCGVYGDMALAEVLDSASSALYTAHEAAERQWVTANSITPSLAVGERLTTRHGAGSVGGIIPERAIYLFIPDAEQMRFASGGGYHLPYEEALAARGEAA